MTLTVAIGGALSIQLNDPLWALVVLVLLKIGVDVFSHLAEHKKYSEGELPAETAITETGVSDIASR